MIYYCAYAITDTIAANMQKGKCIDILTSALNLVLYTIAGVSFDCDCGLWFSK